MLPNADWFGKSWHFFNIDSSKSVIQHIHFIFIKYVCLAYWSLFLGIIYAYFMLSWMGCCRHIFQVVNTNTWHIWEYRYTRIHQLLPLWMLNVYQLILFGFPDLKTNYSQNNNPFTFLSSVLALIKLTAWWEDQVLTTVNN